METEFSWGDRVDTWKVDTARRMRGGVAGKWGQLKVGVAVRPLATADPPRAGEEAPAATRKILMRWLLTG